MPNTTDDPDTIDTTDPTVAAPEPDATTEQTTAPAAAPAASPSAGNGGRTAAEDKLWTALLANPLRTAEELASTAGIGRSTVSKILTRWSADTTVTRTAGTADGARRTADRWSITEPDPAPAPVQAPLNSDVTPTDTSDIDAARADDDQVGDPNPDQAGAETVSDSESETATASTPGTEQQTAEQTEPDLEPPVDGGDHEANSGSDFEPGPDSAPAAADSEESADSVGVIELGNGIALSYPMSLLSDPLSGADGSTGGMVELLRLLAAVSMTTRPARRTGPKQSSAPAEPGMNHSGTARLPKGALRGMVEDFLSEKPGEGFSPNAIAIALGRSSGAVANALDQMVRDGVVTMTSEKPRRYTFAASD
jgi:hypothetical protein